MKTLSELYATVDPREHAEMFAYLSNWSKLSGFLSLGVPSLDQLRLLLVLELQTRARMDIITRITGKYTNIIRSQFKAEVSDVLTLSGRG